MQRLARRLAAAFAVAFVVATSSVLGGSTAAASTPLVVGSCAATIQGAPGTPIQLQPAAVLEPVVNVVRALDPLNLITPTVRGTLAKLPPIPIGAIPTGTGFITAGQIANAVIGQLNKIPLLGPIISAVAQGVQSVFAGMCGVTVQAANTIGAVVQDGSAAMADQANKVERGLMPGGGQPAPGKPGGQQPGKPGTIPGSGTPGSSDGGGIPPGANFPVIGGAPSPLNGWGWGDYGRAPMTDYSSIPFAQAGLYAPSPGVRYGGNVPNYSPQFGILGTDNPPADGVQAAGHAESLGGPQGRRDIDISVLLAVLALSGVTAALVRTWVLRKPMFDAPRSA
ncbi:hypothetical protein [Actinocrispum wychmicini]|uniref:Uncharacterized protein n=1 Tax=Actinocrispum wychmicini TaxID=1213861 RepID=A0A4R2K4J4_9PSEU|nr:hypothetical protein [Actinocrispum wychmicini]TCO64729.1 hypothetical protein EV192_101511 [Actinocrispum wychmicini]